MQRPISWTGLPASPHHRLIHQPQLQNPHQQPLQLPHQHQQRPASFHGHERMNSSSLSAMIAPACAKPDLLQDQRTELPRPYKCPMCDKAFHRLEHQTRHIRTHTGEKPHACSYPGCSKRFSRSDELTRHSRIHTNPNSRRSNKNQQAAAMAAASIQSNAINNNLNLTGSSIDHSNGRMMPPPPKIISKSAPSSHVGSPNVSPPHSYHGLHAPTVHSALSPFTRARAMSTTGGGVLGPLDFSVLAQTASQQLERENGHGRHQYFIHSHGRQSHHYHHQQLPPISQPMSRSHSHEDDDPYISHRSVKKSRPNSPVSTAPSSPTFSHDSCSPTPESTPLATPAHSPRLYPRDFDFTMQLPSIRHLTLRHMPTLAPMEIADPYNTGSLLAPPPPVSLSKNMRLGDIINRPGGSQRKLPVPTVPRVAVHDLLNGSGGGGGE